MTIPQTSPRMFGDLYYANNIPTYVGQPIEDLDNLGQTLEERYYANQDNMDKFTSLVNSTEVRDVNNPYLSQKMEQARTAFQQYHDKGDYENAGNVVRQISRDFTGDRQLQGILKDKKLYDSWLADLNEKESKGVITANQKKDAIIRAKYHNQDATAYDPTTQSYSNLFNGVTPPKYVDINSRVNDIVKQLKDNPSKIYTELQQTKIPFKYRYDEIEGLSPEQLKQAVEDYVKSQDDVQDYLRFQTESADFKNRLGYDANGKLTLREMTEDDLVSSGILDAPGVRKIPHLDVNGKAMYVDANGKEYTSDQVTVDPSTKKVFVAGKNNTKGAPVEMSMVNNSVLMSQLYNPDGTLNQEAAGSMWNQNFRDSLMAGHIKYGTDFAYQRRTPKYEEDSYGKDIAVANHQSALRRQEEKEKYDREIRNQVDIYSDIMNGWEKGKTEKYVAPETMKLLFGETTTGAGGILVPTKESKLGNLSSNIASKLPVIMQIKKLKEELNAYNSGGSKGRPTGNFHVPDPKEVDKAMGNPDKNIALNKEIQDLMALYNLTDADINSKDIPKFTAEQEKVLQVLGRLVTSTKSTTYSAPNTANFRRVNGGRYGDLLLDLDENEVKAALGSSDIDIDELATTMNDIYGGSVFKTGTTKKVGESNSNMYQLKLSVPVQPTFAQQAKVNQSFGIKPTAALQQNLLAATNNASMIGRLEEAESYIKANKGFNALNMYNRLEEAYNKGLQGEALDKYFKDYTGEDLSKYVSKEDSKGDAFAAWFAFAENQLPKTK